MSTITFLNGKKVLVFDTETTGLPERVPGAKWGSVSEYWTYNMNDKYANARIVSIAWAFSNNFNKDLVDNENINHYMRSPEGFSEITNSHIHGITYELAMENGIAFNDIFEKNGLYDALIGCDYIIAHNVNFDIHILMNELFRLGTERAMVIVNKLQMFNGLGRCICSGELGKEICKLKFKSNPGAIPKGNPIKRNKTYKMPKLSELYKHFYNEEFENQHNAEGDVRALLKCLMKM